MAQFQIVVFGEFLENQEMEKIKLYSYFRSSTSFRVRIALYLKRLDFEYIPVHLLNQGGEQHLPEYRALNPIGGVPTLVHKGNAISQSAAIVQYLDEVFPVPRLLPEDPFKRAQIRQFCDNINCEMHPLNNLRVLQFLKKNYQVTDENQNLWVHHWLRWGFEATEKLLEANAGLYCFGNEISMADIFLAPQIVTAKRFSFPIEDFKLTNTVFENVMKLEPFHKAHPDYQPDTPVKN